MSRLIAIALLTWRAALRFRLFVVVAFLLIACVVVLPLVLKDDGTAQGFTQILLTYTLTVITGLLGFSTLWLSCGTLARDIEECQMQMVVVKPVARWQVWLGKWLGIVSLNAALLTLAGGCVFALLQWRAARLEPEQQEILRREVLVSRGSVRPEVPKAEIDAQVEARLREKLAEGIEAVNLTEVRRLLTEQVVSQYQSVPPGAYRWWEINLGRAAASLRGKPMHLRIKFNSAQRGESLTFEGLWQVGVPETPNAWRSPPMSLAQDSFHEIAIPADLFDEEGRMTVVFLNPNDTTLVFPLEEGIEVMFPQGGFLMNYVRALAVILCWMALLASIGLACSSFLSFPVASLTAVTLLVVSFATGTLSLVVSEGTVMGLDASTKFMGSRVVDAVVVPVFRLLLGVIQIAKDFSPIDAVSTGRSIPWTTVGAALLRVVILMGGVFAVAGMVLFNRREMATAQGNQ